MFCQQCGREATEDQKFCPQCGHPLNADAAGPLDEGGRRPTAWEDRSSVGAFRGMFTTLRDVLFAPSDFFRRMPVTGGLTDPLLFGLIVGMFGIISMYFWDIVLHDAVRNIMQRQIGHAGGEGMLEGAGMVFTALFTPVMVIIGLFMAAGILHLFLMMVRGAKAGYEATFRVVGYGMAPYLFMFIPFCGALITLFWILTLYLIGLREAHGTSGGKAAFAVLFPLIFFCGVLVIIMMMFMGAMIASFGTMMHMAK